MYNLVSFCGVFALMLIAWVFSTHRRRMNWRLIVGATALQIAFGFFVFKMPAGTRVFLLLNNLFLKVLGAAQAGVSFVFGSFVDGTVLPTLAFQYLPTIIFFSALMAVLYFIGFMPLLVRGFAWVFTRLLGVSGAEAMATAANIFVGVESALTVRPFLARMTRSELCTVLTAGMATIASSVMGLYVSRLQDLFPNIAGHLMSASILSAPAALIMSKIILPETENPETLGINVKPHYEREATLFDAIIGGANAGVKLVVGIVALLLAVLGLMKLIDMALLGVGWRMNAEMGWSLDWSLQGFLGLLFRPVVALLGVPMADVPAIATIIGERTIATEVAGYMDLARVMSTGGLVFPARSGIIAAYALCGFAHVASMAIFVGGTAALAPERSSDLSRVAVRALLAATLACLMTGAIAGIFVTDSNAGLLLGTRLNP